MYSHSRILFFTIILEQNYDNNFYRDFPYQSHFLNAHFFEQKQTISIMIYQNQTIPHYDNADESSLFLTDVAASCRTLQILSIIIIIVVVVEICSFSSWLVLLLHDCCYGTLMGKRRLYFLTDCLCIPPVGEIFVLFLTNYIVQY